MSAYLKRYWFEFKIENVFQFPGAIGNGCGVCAFSEDDAIKIMDEKIFTTIKRPPISKVIEDVDIRKLNQVHVIPNILPPVYRGIWYPLGYD